MRTTYIVFNFTDSVAATGSIPASHVFKCAAHDAGTWSNLFGSGHATMSPNSPFSEVLKWKLGGPRIAQQVDFAWLRLDAEPAVIPAVVSPTSERVALRESIVVIGHPSLL